MKADTEEHRFLEGAEKLVGPAVTAGIIETINQDDLGVVSRLLRKTADALRHFKPEDSTLAGLVRVLDKLSQMAEKNPAEFARLIQEFARKIK
jgi:hypothetical protein